MKVLVTIITDDIDALELNKEGILPDGKYYYEIQVGNVEIVVDGNKIYENKEVE